MMGFPMVDVFMLPERSVRVPPEWSRRFKRAEWEDRRNIRWFLSVPVESWEARHRVEDEFAAAVENGLEVEDF